MPFLIANVKAFGRLEIGGRGAAWLPGTSKSLERFLKIDPQRQEDTNDAVVPCHRQHKLEPFPLLAKAAQRIPSGIRDLAADRGLLRITDDGALVLGEHAARGVGAGQGLELLAA